MRLYASYFPPPGGDPERPPAMVREGFSPWGLVLGWLVLLRPGSWLCAVLAGLASLLVALLASHVDGAWALGVGIHLTVATFAADWRCWELRLAGFLPGPVVAGADRGQALLRLLERRPELVGRPA